jgi:hypothetical protein
MLIQIRLPVANAINSNREVGEEIQAQQREAVTTTSGLVSLMKKILAFVWNVICSNNDANKG